MAAPETKRRRVAALLDTWRAHGAEFARHGQRITVTGIDAPDWWPDWTERNGPELAALLPDRAAKPIPKREPCPRMSTLDAMLPTPLPNPRREGWRALLAALRSYHFDI